MRRGDRVLVREVPGRWWIAGERTDLLALVPDDHDAFLYLMTSVDERVGCLPRWQEDVAPAPGAACPMCGTWVGGLTCVGCGQDRLL